MTDNLTERISATNAPAKAGHTPGQWRLEYDGSLCMARQIVVRGLIGPDASTVAERRANNNLIAAAPDLLAACKAAENALAALDEVNMLPSGWHSGVWGVIRSAIALAEGGGK